MSDRLFEHAESPSLIVGRIAEGEEAPDAYELKFLVPEAVARAAEEWALGAGRMGRDPHADAATGWAYTTTTLYFDTSALDVYHRREGYARERYRVRRYGDGDTLHLERKNKRGDLVSKLRAPIVIDELSQLATASQGEAIWAGRWFSERVSELSLHPAMLLTYRRTAFVGACIEGPLRLTVDRGARARLCTDADRWDVRPLAVDEGVDVLRGQAVLELKYLTALPLPFKSLLKILNVQPGSASKYRLGRDAAAARL
ncbi:MAG: polyphosphate polymerase domain-containing protein [Phycisphaerales bacterium]